MELTPTNFWETKPAQNTVPTNGVTKPVASSTLTPTNFWSTSPSKLTDESVIAPATQQGLDYNPNFLGDNFASHAVMKGFGTVKHSVEDSADKFLGLFNSLTAKSEYEDAQRILTDENGNVDYSKTTGATIGMTPEQRQSYYEKRKEESSGLNKAVKFGQAGLGVANLGFLPVTVQLEAAKEVPILKYPAQAASYVFEKLGEAGSYTLKKAVEVAPLDQKTKETISPLAEELGAFVSQLVGVHYGFKAAKTGGGKIVEKLPVSDKAKTNIKTGVQQVVGLSMTPFTHLYGVASGLITDKIQQRKDQGTPITPEEGKKIIDEVKLELSNEINTLPKEGINNELSIPEAPIETPTPTPEGIPTAPTKTEALANAETKVAAAPVETVPSPIETSTDTIKKNEFKSRVFERMKAEHPEIEGDVNAEHVILKEDLDRAVDLIEKDKQKAFNIAMGAEVSKEITSTSANIALTEKAIEDGNFELASKLIKNRSLAQTRRGQEISAERGSINDNSTSRYVKELLSTRLENLGGKYLEGIKEMVKKPSRKQHASDIIDTEVKKVEKQIKNKKLDVKTAISLLEKLTCI